MKPPTQLQLVKSFGQKYLPGPPMALQIGLGQLPEHFHLPFTHVKVENFLSPQQEASVKDPSQLQGEPSTGHNFFPGPPRVLHWHFSMQLHFP